ncbi:hypothetical protein Tco_1483179 [Tanacetum coccineum]
MQNTMAEQNVPAQAPARTDEQIVPRSQWLQIRKSNLLFDAQTVLELYEEHDFLLERAIKLSLDPSFLPQGQAPVGGVVIGGSRSEQLPTTEKKSTTDQFILQRRDQAPHDSTTGPSSQPQDDTSEKIVHESPSITDSERTESGTEATAPKVDKERGEEASTTVTSEEGISVRAEDQAGSDPGKGHEALAGSNPEPMHKKDQTGSDS